MSFSMTIFPIIAALLAPEGKFMESNKVWNPINKHQKYFLNNFFSNKEELKNFSEKEIRSWASRDYKELNKIAKDNGFDIQFNPFMLYEFGSISIFDVNLQWLEKGQIKSINYNNSEYKAANLNDENFITYKLPEKIYPNPIAEIQTKSKDKVYITVADKQLKDFELVKRINILRKAIKNYNFTTESFSDLIFPCVDLNHQVNINWIKNMFNDEVFIHQALQQTKFKMNEEGARVESAAMISFCKSCGPRLKRELLIDKPFYVWIERENCSIPIFIGYIDTSDWVKV